MKNMPYKYTDISQWNKNCIYVIVNTQSEGVNKFAVV